MEVDTNNLEPLTKQEGPSFIFSAASCKKTTIFGAAETNIWLFLFCQSFTVFLKNLQVGWLILVNILPCMLKLDLMADGGMKSIMKFSMVICHKIGPA